MKIYKKLYKQTIDFPIILPADGIENNISSDYYILLEKNFLPINSTETIKYIPQDSTSWITLKLIPHDAYYNRLYVQSLSVNNTNTKREVTAKFIANITDNNQITKCNTLYANFIQAPKENISAHIEFIPLTNEQELDNNNLIINGDTQDIKIIYYGLNNDVKITSSNVVSLKINGNNLNKDKIISIKTTGNGIELIYHIDEYIGNTVNNISVSCTYNTEYNTSNITKIIHQNPTIYKIELNIYDNDDNIISNNLQYISQNIKFKYFCKKNDIYITSGVQLIFENITNIPVIKHNETSLIIQNNEYVQSSYIYENISNQNRQLKVYAKYNNIISNEIILIQNNYNQLSDLNIYTNLYNIDTTTPNTITGLEQDIQIIYYLNIDGNQYTSIVNNINGVNIVNDIISTIITDNIIKISDNVYNTASPYKILTIHVPANLKNEPNIIEIKFSIYGIEKIYQITQNNLTTNIDIKNITVEAGGFNTNNNLVIIQYRAIISETDIITEDSYFTINFKYLNNDPIDDPANLIPDLQMEYQNTMVISNFICKSYKFVNNYGYEIIQNRELPLELQYIITYHNGATKTGTILRYPVFFDTELNCQSIPITDDYYNINTNGQTAVIFYKPIVYNYYNDLDNYIIDTNVTPNGINTDTGDNYFILSCNGSDEVLDNITFSSKSITTNGLLSNLTFVTNDYNMELIIQLTFNYYGISKYIKFKQQYIPLFINLYIDSYAIYDKATDEYIYQTNTNSQQLYINPFTKTQIQIAAVLRNEIGTQLNLINPGIFKHNLEHSLSNYKLKYTVTHNDALEDYIDYMLIDIDENYGLDSTHNLSSLLDISISYKPGNYKGNDSNLITSNNLIKLIKPQLTGTLYESFNLTIDSTDETNITIVDAKRKQLILYTLFTYKNTQTNEIYQDTDINHYTLANRSNYKADNDNTYNIITDITGPIYANGKIQYVIQLNTISIMSRRSGSPDPEKTFTILYNNKLNSYYDTSVNKSIKIIQTGIEYSFEYYLTSSIQWSEDEDNFRTYELNSNDTEFYLYIICKENNTVLTERQNINVEILFGNLNITFTYVNIINGIHTYKCTLDNNFHRYDISDTCTITYVNKSESFDILQLGCNTYDIDLFSNKSEVNPTGGTINITYAVYADNIKSKAIKIIYPDNNLTITGKLNNTPISFGAKTSDTKNIYHTTYSFPVNNTNENNTLILTAQYTDMLGDPDYEVSLTKTINVIQLKQTSKLTVNISKTTNNDGSSDIITISYYATLNNQRIQITNDNVNIIGFSYNDENNAVVSTSVTVSNNTVYRTININEYLTNNENILNQYRKVKFYITYNEETIEKTYTQYYGLIRSVLTYNSNENTNILYGANEISNYNKTSGGTNIKLHFYGLKNNTRIIDKDNITLYCSQLDDMSEPSVSSDELISNIIIPSNNDIDDIVYNFYAEFNYNSTTIRSNIISFTQEPDTVQLYMSVDKQILTSSYNIITISYWAQNSNGLHIYDPQLFNFSINGVPGYTGLSGYTISLNNVNESTKTVYTTYEVYQNNSNNEKRSSFKVVYGDQQKDIIIVQGINGDNVINIESDFIILNYNAINPNNLENYLVTTYRNINQLDNINNYAGTYLQTITTINANNAININVNNNIIDLRTLTIGINQTINNDYNSIYKDYIRYSGNSIDKQQSIFINFKNILNCISNNTNEIIFNIYGNWCNTRSTGDIKFIFNMYEGDADDIYLNNNIFKTNNTLSGTQEFIYKAYDITNNTDNLTSFTNILQFKYFINGKRILVSNKNIQGNCAYNIYVMAPEPFCIIKSDNYTGNLSIPYRAENFTLLQWDQSIQQIVDLTTNTPILNKYESIPDYNLSVISNGGLIISPTETPNVLQVNYTSSNIGNTYHLQFKLNDNTNININLTIEEPIL